MADVITFPGAGARRPAPGRRAPLPMPDRDAMGERYVAYCEALENGRRAPVRVLGEADQLAHAVATDCGHWRDEVDRIEALRIELAAEVDRLLEENDRLRGGA